MRENGWVPVRAQEQSIRTEARRGFQKHVVRFARAEHLQSWEKNQVRPEVVLVNSHDKSSAYQLHCGLFRLVCTNGMVVSDGTFQRISIKHSGFNPDSVIEASFKVLTPVPDIMNKVQLFQDRILTDAGTLSPLKWDTSTRAATTTGVATAAYENRNFRPLLTAFAPPATSSLACNFLKTGKSPLCGLFAGQADGHEFSDILANPTLSIKQTDFQKVGLGVKRHETNTFSRNRSDEFADDRCTTPAFNSRNDAQYICAFLSDH